MENFKLDLRQLTPVAEADRVRGNWYVVADDLDEYGVICQWHSGRHRISPNDGGKGVSFDLWFAIPPNLPGLPKGDLPDCFQLKKGEWEYTNIAGQFVTIPMNSTFRRIKTFPFLTIPSGTIEEQIEATKKILAELETKAGGIR